MKLSKFKSNKEIIQAILDGKQIQHATSVNGPWYDTTDAADNLFDCYGYHYRIKPTPTLRPWRPEEVPVGAIIFDKRGNNFHRHLIVGVDNNGLVAMTQQADDSCINLLAHYEHSLDHGKTWQPCGVLTEG